jgi:pimeloyl-ACP methyl ester carboxylesterase
MARLIESDPISNHPLQTVRANEHETAFIRHGDGPPLVLLHGYAGAAWNWEHQIEALAKRFTVYIPDLLGHGLSAKPHIPFTPVTYLGWLQGFMKAVGIEKADFVGNSMGCGLILALALTQPKKINRMVLISGFPAEVLDQARAVHLKRFKRLGMGFVFALAYQFLGPRAFRKLLCGIVFAGDQITPEVVERAYRLRKDHGMAWPLWSSLCQVDQWERQFAPRLNEITAPTLILWGEQDRFFPPSVGEILHRSMPASRLVLIPQAGHLPMWERPDVVNRLILDFLTAPLS